MTCVKPTSYKNQPKSTIISKTTLETAEIIVDSIILQHNFKIYNNNNNFQQSLEYNLYQHPIQHLQFGYLYDKKYTSLENVCFIFILYLYS